MAKLKRQKKLPAVLLFFAFVTMSSSLLAATATTIITSISISPVPEGDALLIAYEGDINSISLSIDEEKHATLEISRSRISPDLSWGTRTGKLISALKLETNRPFHTKIMANFKRRLGRHSREQISKHGKNFIRIEFLDEVAEKHLKLSDKSVIQPVVEQGIFELGGSKKKQPLDYSKDDRKEISTEAFLALFGREVKPRPNRITDVSYLLTDESLELTLALHKRPLYALKSRHNPPGVELKLTKTLGDFEINHGSIQHNFLGNIITTRNNSNTLEMKADLYETAEISSKTIKNPHKPGYLFIIKIIRIYPWERAAAIPDIDIR